MKKRSQSSATIDRFADENALCCHYHLQEEQLREIYLTLRDDLKLMIRRQKLVRIFVMKGESLKEVSLSEFESKKIGKILGLSANAIVDFDMVYHLFVAFTFYHHEWRLLS